MDDWLLICQIRKCYQPSICLFYAVSMDCVPGNIQSLGALFSWARYYTVCCISYSGIDGYINEGIGWTTNALEKQLAISSIVHGSNAGALLICGRSKSSANAGYGITTVAKAICRRAVDYPLLAHIIVLECSDYRGRPTKVKEVLSDKMLEARWYQPSILLLDDLDHIAPSFSNGHDHGSDVMNADRTAESEYS